MNNNEQWIRENVDLESQRKVTYTPKPKESVLVPKAMLENILNGIPLNNVGDVVSGLIAQFTPENNTRVATLTYTEDGLNISPYLSLFFGSPAAYVRPVALRPQLAMGLLLSETAIYTLFKE